MRRTVAAVLILSSFILQQSTQNCEYLVLQTLQTSSSEELVQGINLVEIFNQLLDNVQSVKNLDFTLLNNGLIR